MFLEGKRMWSYVDGSIPCPTDVERDFATKYFEWNASNKAIMTWLLGAMNPIIASSHMFLSTAKGGRIRSAKKPPLTEEPSKG